MKKIVCAFLSLFIAVSALAGCDDAKNTDNVVEERSKMPEKVTAPDKEITDDEPEEAEPKEDAKIVNEETGTDEPVDEKEYFDTETKEDFDTMRKQKEAENAAKRTINGALNDFSVTTLDGRSFTQSDIANYDITVINFWGTYCGPCIAEMPDLAEFYDNLPSGINFVTYCVDGNANREKAKSIISDAGLDALVIIGSSGDFNNVLGQLMYIPTTIFVSRNGDIVGYELIGGTQNLFDKYMEHINDAFAETDR